MEGKWDIRVKNLKDEILNRLITHIQYPSSIKLLCILLVQCKHSNDSMIELEWKQYSQTILDKLITKLSTGPLLLHNIEDIKSIYTLCNELNITAISPDKLVEGLLNALSIKTSVDLKVNLEHRYWCKIPWLPSVLIVIIRIILIFT